MFVFRFLIFQHNDHLVNQVYVKKGDITYWCWIEFGCNLLMKWSLVLV